MVTKSEVMETAIESGQILTGERLVPNWNLTHLTPLEHAIMGSSVYMVEDSENELISGEGILAREDGFILRPLGVTQRGMDIAQVLRDREGKFIEGYFPTFHSSAMVKGGYHERIWLPTEVQEDGTIRPRFRVQLIGSNGEVVEDEALIGKILKITRRREYFTLSHGEHSGERIIEFKKPTSKAA